MTFTAVLLASLALPHQGSTPPAAAPDSGVYRGVARELAVSAPRLESAEVRVDGILSEPAWAAAAVLTGFSQFQPVEGAAATERTEVLLFYTPDALHVGIRAFARDPSRVRATLADRDRIGGDDRVQLLLDTFHDRRRAYSLAVNPLGIQQDGIHNDGAGGRGSDEDLSPDFLFESRGRQTPEGYVVELRIPLKSLKFPTAEVQSWGINVVRHIAASGATESWAPLTRNNPSRLAQSGVLRELSGLEPGRLLEFNPVVTGRRVGERGADGRFLRESPAAELGANLKYGITSNLTLDATYNPDFSQVEADAAQITTNERFPIFYPEKRPFFLEGADLFTSQAPLVRTRAIVNPVAGLKLTGQLGGMTLGYLGALDESPLFPPNDRLSPNPSRAAFQVARLLRDLGGGSTLGMVLTDREASGEYNRVASADARVRFARSYTWEVQAAQSWTRRWIGSAAGSDTALVGDRRVPVTPLTEAGHLFQTSLDLTTRERGFYLRMQDVPSDFRADAGGLRRRGLTDFFGVFRVTRFGAPGALLQSWTPRISGNQVFAGRDLWRGEGAEEGEMGLELDFELRGNNRIEVAYSNSFFVLDPGRYAAFAFGPDGARVTGAEALAGAARHDGLHALSLEASSAYFKSVAAEVNVGWAQLPIFAEGTPGEQFAAGLELQLRPTDALRAELDLRHERLYRRRDGSLYSRATLPRIRAEYQISRAVFVRAVAQYAVEEVDLLRAPDGTPYEYRGAPLRVRGGGYRQAALLQTNPLRADLLFSYQPSPGTVLFVGYGREMEDGGAYRFSALDPRSDGLFFKLSYLFRN